ncbi:BamA/TamA family outer membrane protein [Fontibacter flavus]|uniref:BamA/TamA family outer membrane protein n=1 Tax=Fontibacter flavus TaxID=654838 RepID=A0ABV6FWZ4_9BACT
MKSRLFCFLVFLMLSTFSSSSKAQEIMHRVFLIGDGGELNEDSKAILKKIQYQTENLKSTGSKVDFLFLGDNIYPKGMPQKGHFLREVSEEILDLQIGLVGSENRAWFIPGNHDWEKGKEGGLNAVLRQQAYLDSLAMPNIHWSVRDGCPGPEEVMLNEQTVLVLVDSQWWLHPYQKAGETNDCEYKTKDDVIFALKDIFQKHKDKIILLAIHHPIYTYGEHNGAYDLKQHLFPLTDIKSNFWLPLPILGSIYPMYRSLFGNIQDVAHPVYKDMIARLEPLFADHPCVIVASGHEHVLQYRQVDQTHYVVSGSAAKTSRLRKRNPLEFGSESKGFATLDYLSDSSMNITFHGSGEHEILFSKNIKIEEKIEHGHEDVVVEYPAEVTTPLSYLYYANRLQRKILGSNYRTEWQTSIQMPVIKIHEEKGGMEIIKRGGGMQTRSLRVRDSLGVEYVLRSVEKYPELAIPSILRQTIAKEIVQDQISASNPFGALVISPLAAASGVWHTVPEMIWLPDEPALGYLREDFRENVYLFENRDVSPELLPFEDYKIYSTDKTIAKLIDDNDNFVNQEHVLRARMLDLFIGDWDRHEDQWRWVGRETKKGREFFPVPRDRDQAFFVNQGLLPRITSRKWIMPKFQGFDYEIRDVNGFMFNGRHFDRSFLNGLSQEKWEEIIRDLQDAWTDEVIDSAMNLLPKEIYDIQGQSIAAKLKYRRSWMLEKGLEYYRFLAKEVDITGSSKMERFDVHFTNEGNVHLLVRKISKSGNKDQVLHDRVYFSSETKEIRLYGLGGNDEFYIDGIDSGKGIKVRIIGGMEANKIEDRSQGLRSIVQYYVMEGQEDDLAIKGSSKVLKGKDQDIFEYDRKAFQYENTSPVPSLEYNVDDGFYLGGGLAWTKHGFRKHPYKISQVIKANVAFNTGAFNFYYDAHAVDIFHNWDLDWHADIRAPNYIHNFYGFGNESVNNREIFDNRFYWARINMGNASVNIRKPIGKYADFKIGPALEFARLDDEDNEGRFIDNPELSGLDIDFINQAKLYAGISSKITYERVDHAQMPTRGLRFWAESKFLDGLNEFSNRYGTINSDLSLYWSFRENSRFTWATRFGGGVNFGNYEFFQAQNLGGKVNLRGFRRFRFAGDAAVFNNTELRIRFISLKTYLFPASSGMILFHDVGRVFLKDENSQKWHTGYGFGLWIAPLKRIVILGNLSFGSEGTLPSITFGYQF